MLDLMSIVALASLLAGMPPSGPLGNAHQMGTHGVVASGQRPRVVYIAASPSVWKFTRVQGAKDGENSAAIMKTADTVHSDADFAGLIIRCLRGGKLDAMIAVIRPMPPRSLPQVTITTENSGSQTFEASMAASGSAILLPSEVSAFIGTTWLTTPSLSIVIKENDGPIIKGVVGLDGLSRAYQSLLPSCGL